MINIHQKINIRSFFPPGRRRLIEWWKYYVEKDFNTYYLYKDSYDSPIWFHKLNKKQQFKEKF